MADNEQNSFLNVTNLNDEQKNEINRIIDGEKYKEEKVGETIEKLLENESSDEIKSISARFKKFANSIDKDPKMFADVCDTLNKFVGSLKTNLTDDSKDYENKKKQLENAEKIINAVKLPFEICQQVVEGRIKYKEANEAIEEYKDESRLLREKEIEVKKLVFPLFQALKNRLNSDGKKINKTYEEKFISNWKNKNDLETIKNIVDSIGKEIGQTNLYTDQIHKLTETINQISEINKEINNQEGQSEMGGLITDLNKNIHYGKDYKLNKAMETLEYSEKSSLVIEKCERAYDAYKQYYFPFAANDFDSPDNRNSNVEAMKTKVADVLEVFKEIKERLDTDSTQNGVMESISKPMNCIATINQTHDHHPLYIWKYKDNKDGFKQLLKGTEITLDARIKTSPIRYSAVKFKQIGIYFRFAADPNLEKEFYDQIASITIKMKLTGNNYYRCTDKLYYITLDDVFEFQFQIRRNQSGIHFQSGNDIYKKFMEGEEYFLSPFAKWQISLHTDYNQLLLSEFYDKDMSIELVGIVKFLKDDEIEETCKKETLKDFYNLYDKSTAQ